MVARSRSSPRRSHVWLAPVLFAVLAFVPGTAHADSIVYPCSAGQALCEAGTNGEASRQLIGDPEPGTDARRFDAPSVSADGTRMGYRYGSQGFLDRKPITGSPSALAGSGIVTDLAISPSGATVNWIAQRISIFGGLAIELLSQPFDQGTGPATLRQNATGLSWIDDTDFTTLEQPAGGRSFVCRATAATQGQCFATVAADPARDLFAHDVTRDGRTLVARACATGDPATCTLELFNTADGSILRDLGVSGADTPSFSPDGRYVAYAGADGIYRVPTAGGKATRIFAGGTNPEWAGPDDSSVSRPIPLRSTKVKVRSGRARVSVTCRLSYVCRGTVRLQTRNRRSLGSSVKVSLRAGQRKTISVRLSAAGRRELARKRRVSIRVVAKIQRTARSATSTQNATLRR